MYNLIEVADLIELINIHTLIIIKNHSYEYFHAFLLMPEFMSKAEFSEH
jgi:hypothetical protein